MMPNYFAALALVLMVAMVQVRVFTMSRRGIQAMQFGKTHKTDFLIPPFPLFYFYLIFAAAFGWPIVSRQEFFHSALISWLGVFFCLLGLLVFLWGVVSFGKSFRVGIDTEHPDQLVTTGAFAFSRNPLYLAFGIILLGEFLVFSNWLLLLFLVGGIWLFHRQVLREEDYLKKHYGEEFEQYARRVRRYL